MAPKASIPVFLAAVVALFIIMALSRVPEPAAGLSGKKPAAPATGLSGKRLAVPGKPAAKKILTPKLLEPKLLEPAAKIRAGRTSPAPKILPDRRQHVPPRSVLNPAPVELRRLLATKAAGADDVWWEAPLLPAAPGRASGAPLPSMKTRPPGEIGGSASAAGNDDVPESSTLILLGIGLVALAWFGRRWMEPSP